MKTHILFTLSFLIFASSKDSVEASPAANQNLIPSLQSTLRTDFDFDFETTFEEKTLYFKLIRTGSTLKGSYFFNNSLQDFDVEGTAHQNNFVLIDVSKVSSHAEWHFDLKEDFALQGFVKSRDGTQHTIHLKRIQQPSKSPVLIATKQRKYNFKSKQKAQYSSSHQCTIDFSYAEILGLHNRNLQNELNEQLKAPVVREAECEVPAQYSGSYKILINKQGLLHMNAQYSVLEDTRPIGNSLKTTSLLIDVIGPKHQLTIEDIIDNKAPKFIEQLRRTVANVTLDSFATEYVMNQLPNGEEVEITKEGITFCASEYPQAFHALSGCQYKLDFSQLKPFLKPSTRFAIVWSK